MYETAAAPLGVLDLSALLIVVCLVFFTEFRPSWSLLMTPAAATAASTTSAAPKGERRLGIRDIPGPCSLPVLGTRWIYYSRYSLNKIHEAYRDMFKRWGEVVKEEGLWNVPVVSIRGRRSLEKVLAAGGRYPLRPPTEATAHYRAKRKDRYTNLGIINEQGETWSRLRAVLTPELMSGRTMGRFFPELVSLGQDFAALLKSKSSSSPLGDVIAFDDLACRMGLESTCAVVLGRRMGFLEQELSSVAGRLAQAVKDQFCASRDTFFGLPFWKLFPTPAYNKFIASEDVLYDIISEMVDEAVKAEDETCPVDAARSVFMAILQAPGLDIKDKKAAIIDFIAAGIKTLGNTLVFLLYTMAKNPDCQRKLYEEITALAPEHSPLTPQVLRSATYLRACLTESFRVLPTAPWVARILETAMELDGYHLRPGTVIMCHTWAACMEESNFPEAGRFLPERWTTGTAASPAPATPPPTLLVAPFGAGRRSCPGKRFVELHLQVVLAQLVRQFEISYEGELELEFEFLLAPEAPVHFRFQERV